MQRKIFHLGEGGVGGGGVQPLLRTNFCENIFDFFKGKNDQNPKVSFLRHFFSTLTPSLTHNSFKINSIIINLFLSLLVTEIINLQLLNDKIFLCYIKYY